MIRFTPPTQVSAGFEYYLKYTTDHRIASRTQLRGFDTVYLGPGSRLSFTLANRYEDRRPAMRANYAYRIVVFGHTAGSQYRLTCTLDGVAGAAWTTFSGRSARVASPVSGNPANPVLWVMRDGQWTRYAEDWALYDGNVEETGQTTVELRIRTAAELVSPASPKYFYAINFSGAEAGMALTLHKECSLRPCFLSSPGYGSVLRFADVAQHRIRQSELLEALAHLFNLRFYTEEATRRVFIEPADGFYGSGPEADWRTKTDFSQPVVLEEIAPQIHEVRTWCYQEGDGAVKRYESDADTAFGAWNVRTDSCAAKQGERTERNPLFGPTLNSTGHYRNAPAAQLMQVGDRDDAAQDGTNFTPRIVRYMGMHPLPDGQRWGYPLHAAEYPLAAFHFAGDATAEPFTLCFEDRDGAQGLHRYYDRQTTQEATRQRISLSLRLGRPTNSQRSWLRERAHPTSGRYSCSTRAATRSGRRSTPSATTTPPQARSAVRSPACRKTENKPFTKPQKKWTFKFATPPMPATSTSRGRSECPKNGSSTNRSSVWPPTKNSATPCSASPKSTPRK